ncbi:cystathionine gamma-synthase [Corynebacterium sp. sy017]|uniref:cystathionine gamma-synthase n=1 Tax=unclassified Corynebacterium TaxID=2624378 RepID=UPI0011847FA4|nr:MULTISPECIES: cystathionine gamma-synthase [unclassified Corynebacterium]MBP3088196.1 cystathionine gamma-synthase [Corynebacterium sp. sy017]TSD92698.1 cystathionine gamma-synthase [Corynebacterium sp. SY003]
MASDATQGFSTASIHAGYEPDSLYGSINTPIYASTTFAQNGLNELRGGFEYTRCGNPTIAALEKTVAALEQASYGRAFSSGMAAIDLVLRAILRPGDHLIFGHDAYGGTFRLVDTTFREWGITYTVVDTTKVEDVAAAIQDTTKLVWLETPSNPTLAVSDIAAIAGAIADYGITLAVDNTFASPYLQNPLLLGADIVIHSTTKYLGGHSDVVGGVVVTNDATLDEQLAFLQGGVGPIPSVFDAYLTARGIKTLALRMERHCDNAEAVAQLLRSSDKVARVFYPGLSDDPGNEVATKQMKRFGGMVSVLFHTEQAARTFCLSTKLICLAESLGGVESLLEHPATMTHQSVTGSSLEVPRELVRISLGIEDTEDLLADVTQALEQL